MRTSKSDIQQKILAFIRVALRENGYPPSVREIGEAVGLKSTSSVHTYLTELENRGFLRRDASKPRAIELVNAPQGRTVPLLGRVTAGQPILAQQAVEDELLLPEWIAADDETFALRVEGESMIDAGILDGDIIIVKSGRSAENGDIVVAMLDDEATVKRIYYENRRVRLQPENAAMAPIYAPSVTVLGRVIGLLRSY